MIRIVAPTTSARITTITMDRPRRRTSESVSSVIHVNYTTRHAVLGRSKGPGTGRDSGVNIPLRTGSCNVAI